MSRALQADELGDVLEVLAEDKVLAFRDDRHVAHAELQQPLASAGIVEHVDGFEIDAFTRKKLFRPETAASPRLGEENEFFGDSIHAGLSRERKESKATPVLASSVKATPSLAAFSLRERRFAVVY